MFVFKLFIISFFLLSVPYGVGCLVRHKPLSRAQPLISEQDSPTYHDPMVFNIVSLRISVPRLASKSSVVGTYSSLRLLITCPKNADGLFLVCLTCTLRECGHYCWTFFFKIAPSIQYMASTPGLWRSFSDSLYSFTLSSRFPLLSEWCITHLNNSLFDSGFDMLVREIFKSFVHYPFRY